MTRAPIAVVAALRETSVVFAALIGVALLGEPFRPQRAAAALVIFVGVVALRLGWAARLGRRVRSGNGG
jgi:drug/metabolite transporter (DMT)-like permease